MLYSAIFVGVFFVYGKDTFLRFTNYTDFASRYVPFHCYRLDGDLRLLGHQWLRMAILEERVDNHLA